jgi:hypothetical protein
VGICFLLGDMLGRWMQYQEYRQIESHYQNLKQKKQKNPAPALLYQQESLFRVWADKAQQTHCQILKIHPLFLDNKSLHFNLHIKGEYDDLLFWLKEVHKALPDLAWLTVSLYKVTEGQLEMLVNFYENI